MKWNEKAVRKMLVKLTLVLLWATGFTWTFSLLWNDKKIKVLTYFKGSAFYTISVSTFLNFEKNVRKSFILNKFEGKETFWFGFSFLSQIFSLDSQFSPFSEAKCFISFFLISNVQFAAFSSFSCLRSGVNPTQCFSP